MSRSKVRLGIGAAAAAALAAGALTTAYASPWGHGSNSLVTANAGASAKRWSPNLVTGTTTLKAVSSTVPTNGDVNPYGVAVVQHSVGNLIAGDVLVSNYNNKGNLNGTGSSIVEINPQTGRKALFAWLTPSHLPSTCPGGIGLTTALVVLNNGWVVVGSLPSKDGTASTVNSGCLIVLNSLGHAKIVLTGRGIMGPWGMTAWQNGDDVQLFVSNILNGVTGHMGQQVNKGTVVRISLDVTRQTFRVKSAAIIASGIPEMASKDAFVQGPTGVALIGTSLYFADTLGNRIGRIDHATTRTTSEGLGATLTEAGLLQGPLGVTAVGNVLLVANGNNGNLVAVSTAGQSALIKSLDTTAAAGSMPGAGALFGLAPSWNGQWVFYVNDLQNNLSAVGPLHGTTSSTGSSSNGMGSSSTPSMGSSNMGSSGTPSMSPSSSYSPNTTTYNGSHS